MIKNKTTINSAIWATVALLIAYAIRWIIPYDPNQTLLISAAMMARHAIHVCLLIAWCISIQRRLTNRQVRNLLIAVGILMAFWLTVTTSAVRSAEKSSSRISTAFLQHWVM